MATEQRIRASEVGRAFAGIIREDARIPVKKLWVRDAHDHIDLWLLTEPVSYEDRLHLRVLKRRLYDCFPNIGVTVQIHIEHAGLYEVEPEHFRFEAPQGASTVKVH